MRNTSSIRQIIWDFDGVLINSDSIRSNGFRMVLSDYPETEVDKLLEYHLKNGGLSRYVKFEYFFNNIHGESISYDAILKLANQFSLIMKDLMIKPDLLIYDSISFIKSYYKEISMHVVSGSDEEELKFLCKRLDIDKYFISLHGSPTPKIDNVQNLLIKYGYDKGATVLIGDSINDYEAAVKNGIRFYGYNNTRLKEVSDYYVYDFSTLII